MWSGIAGSLTRTIPTLPLAAATCNGVFPERSVLFTSAPSSISHYSHLHKHPLMNALLRLPLRMRCLRSTRRQEEESIQ